MQNKWLISSICVFIIGILCGYVIGGNTANKGSSAGDNTKQEYADIQKNELSIDSDFFEVDDPVYNKGHLITKIYLTEKGKRYNATDLFSPQYTVTVSLINNQTDEPYVMFDEMVWDINKDLNVDLVIDLNKIKGKDVLSDFNKQLKEMKNGSKHNIMYQIEVVPQKNPDNVMRNIGMLHEK